MGEPDEVPESPDVAFKGNLNDLEIIETIIIPTPKKRLRVAK
jgi:hypothetical protein